MNRTLNLHETFLQILPSRYRNIEERTIHYTTIDGGSCSRCDITQSTKCEGCQVQSENEVNLKPGDNITVR